MDLQEKTILITGASSGIGLALVQILAQRGAHLILASRKVELLQAIKSKLPNADVHRVLALDLSQPDAVFQQLIAALAEFPPIDILISNAGVSQRSFAAETPLSVDRYLLDVNYLGTIATTKAVLPNMLQRGTGMIVTVSSVAGKVGSQMRSSYSGAKHALIGFMDSLRAEVGKQGIVVVVACPGWVQTNISLNALNAEGKAENKMDSTTANGISAQQCAEKIIWAMERKQPEIIIGKGLSRLAPTVKRFFPSFYRWLIARKVYR